MIDVDQEKLLAIIRALPKDDRYARAAIFDADHTLWAADLGDDAFRRALADRSFDAAAGPALARILEKYALPSSGDPHDDAARIHARYLAGGVSEQDIIATELVCYAGWRVADLRALARKLLEAGLEEAFHEEIEPMLVALAEEGYRIHVVSGSPHWLVQEAVERLGIHAEHVMGARVRIEEDRLTDEIEAPLTFWEGKVEAVRTWLGRLDPRLVFGDSDGDLAMLLSAQLPVAVNPRPGLRAALEAERHGRWCHFMPRRTRGGREVRPHDTDRVIV